MQKVTIYVNTREYVVEKSELTYMEVIELAYPNPQFGQLITWTITYRRGQGNKPEGTLQENETLRLKEGMIIDVDFTDRS